MNKKARPVIKKLRLRRTEVRKLSTNDLEGVAAGTDTVISTVSSAVTTVTVVSITTITVTDQKA